METICKRNMQNQVPKTSFSNKGVTPLFFLCSAASDIVSELAIFVVCYLTYFALHWGKISMVLQKYSNVSWTRYPIIVRTCIKKSTEALTTPRHPAIKCTMNRRAGLCWLTLTSAYLRQSNSMRPTPNLGISSTRLLLNSILHYYKFCAKQEKEEGESLAFKHSSIHTTVSAICL